MKKQATAYWFLWILFVPLSACDKFEFSPYQTDNTARPSELNNKNILKLLAKEKESDDTIRFVFTGDSQRFYNELEDLIGKVNTLPGIDFLVLAGDISDFGLLQEFLWINDRLERLNIPYMAVVGNHDLLANGGVIYKAMFGEKNFSFMYKKYKFIFHDTNSREYGFNGSVPNMPWLHYQLNDKNAQWMVGVSHIPPYDTDFDRALEEEYKNLFSSHPSFILSLNGHRHETWDSFHYDDHVRYITSNAVNKKSFIVFELVNGNITKNLVEY